MSLISVPNRKAVLVLGLVIVIIGVISGVLLMKKPITRVASTNPSSSPSQNNQTDFPKVVSTKPDPLDETIISATEVLEITFNRPLENVGEFKLKIEPKTDYKLELSGDRKTARIKPVQAYELGTTYTLSIGTETKFDGLGRWGQEKVFHFKTIRYRGI